MKILQINASYKPAYIYGGPTMSVAALSEQLTAAGHNVDVYTTTANGMAELAVDTGLPQMVDGVRVTYFKRITKDHSHLSPALLKHLWKTVKQFDVIHIHAWWNLVSVLSALIVFIHKKPLIISPRGTLSSYTFTYKNSQIKRLLHTIIGKRLLASSCIHVTSAPEAAAMRTLFRQAAISNIPNFVHIASTITPKGKVESPALKLLFMSRIDPKKGIDILLTALPLFNVPYSLTIAGDGDSAYINSLKNIATANQSAAHINWPGFVKGDAKFDVLQQHDLLILPSHDENFGNVVIESLATGTAVLLSKHVGLAGYVSQNNLGWICDINAESIADAVNTIGRDRKQLPAIAQAAPGIIAHDFDSDKLTSQYLQMYSNAINKRL